ncbi:MAG: YaaR family protein [Oscillospiraceae bacterium]
MKVRYAPVSEKTVDMSRLVERGRDLPASSQSFEHSFNSFDREQYEQSLAKMAKKIEEQGARLANKTDIAEMERYRLLISELLTEVTCHAYAFQKENSFDPRGRRKVYAIIVKINEKLEEMAKEILNGSRDKLKILSSIDDIRGLIVDLFL